jgi:hypothetical protein
MLPIKVRAFALAYVSIGVEVFGNMSVAVACLALRAPRCRRFTERNV